jgi:hypothetical protein
MTDARVSGVVVETVVTTTPDARLSGEVVETALVPTPDARLSGEVVETALIPVPDLRFSGMVVETVLSNYLSPQFGIVAVGAPTTEVRIKHPDGVWRVLRSVITPSSPAFTPLSIPGCTLWIDASQDVGLFTDGAVVPTLTLPDHATGRTYATTGGFGPVWRASLGGRPAYEWVSNAYGLDAGTWNPGTAGVTFVFVGQITGGSYPMMVVYGPDADGIEMRHDGTSMQIVVLYSSYGIVFSHGTPDTVGTDTIHAIRVRAGAGTDAWINTVKVTGAAPAAMPNTTQALYVGRRQGGYPFIGPMREVLAYTGPVSDADMTLLIDYLKTKWGLS